MKWQSGFTEKQVAQLLKFAKKAVQQGGLWIIINENGIGASTHYGLACVPIFLMYENAANFDSKNLYGKVEKQSIGKIINEVLHDIENADHRVLLPDMDDDFDVDMLPIELVRILIWANTGQDPACSNN